MANDAAKPTDGSGAEKSTDVNDRIAEERSVQQPQDDEPKSAAPSEEQMNVETPNGADDPPLLKADQGESTTGMKLNGTKDDSKGVTAESNTGRPGSVRSTSSKFASLRAAFEQNASGDGASDGLKRRLTSNPPDDRGKEKRLELETEVARLKEELEKEKELRIAYEEKVTGLEEEIEELTSQLEEADDGLREEFEQKMSQERSEANERLSVMENEARSQKQEATTLQKQVSDLKRGISESTRMSSQISDSTIRQEMEMLQYEIQNWVVNNFRRVKVEASPDDLCVKLEKVTETKQHERLQSMYSTFDSSVKLPIYQATVACYMMEIFDDAYLFGLHGKLDWSKRVRQAADALKSTLEPSAFNRWRSLTFDTLRQAEDMKGLVESAANGLAEMICITLKAMTDVEDNEARLTSLSTILKRAIALAHLIRVQQPQYEFALPIPDETFDADFMEEVTEDGDANSESSIRCATFPSVTKVGDEDGANLSMRNLVVKAKVLLKEEDES